MNLQRSAISEPPGAQSRFFQLPNFLSATRKNLLSLNIIWCYFGKDRPYEGLGMAKHFRLMRVVLREAVIMPHT
jgi:hypothetical protein